MNASRAILVVLILVLGAGCNAAGPTDGTQAATTTEQPSVTTTESLSYPPGTNESGIVSQSTIYSTHRAVLANQSYSFTALQQVDGGDEEQRVDLQSNPSQKRAALQSSGTGQLADTELFISEEAVYIKQGSGDSAKYEVREPETDFSKQHARQVGIGYVMAVLNAGRYEPAGQSTFEGTTVWNYELVAYEGGDGLPENATDATGSVKIDENGAVRHATVSLTTTGENGTAEMVIEYRVHALGDVDVPEPDWLSEATQG